MEGKVTAVLAFMKTQGLNLEIFLDAVFWGHPACTANRAVIYERTNFLDGPTLDVVLRRLWKPPTRARSHEATMRDFVTDAVNEIFEQEMKDIAAILTPPKDALSEEHLTSIDFHALGRALQSVARALWALFERLASTARQRKENVMKEPFLIILMTLAMLAYSRSHHVCLVPAAWSIYLKSCGLSARAFDALHAMGVTMSHKWTADAYTTISKTAKRATQLAICEYPHFGSHDNLNIPMRVFSQRLFNKNHFINASAATIWVLPKEAFAFLPKNIRDLVHSQRRAASKQQFSVEELYEPPPEVNTRVRAFAKHRILRFLLESPEFTQYAHRSDPVLAAPPPTDLLPCGPSCVVKQHILETVEVDESSYEGTDQLCNVIWPQQMGYGSEEERRKTGNERILVWVGDQLTVERMRGLARYRYDDANSYERMDWLEPHFGWFHALMALANSLHSQYLGTSAGIGLRKAFEVLGRKGLMKQETKGPFWHDLDEALWHIGEANFRALWCEVAKVECIDDLTVLSPSQIAHLAEEIYSNHASRAALTRMQTMPDDQRDTVKEQMVMFSTDLLPYFNLREAIRIGDVGRMEDLLPTLLFRFAGGGNHKYALEILELIQKLRHEWPETFRTYIRRYCWLLNRTGKRDGFFPVDLGQEHNIRDIKVTWRSFGPGATFGYIQKISPAITIFRAVREGIRSQFPSLLGRGKRHGSPAKDADVARLTAMYMNSKVHHHIPNRTMKTSGMDIARDVVSIGADRLVAEGTIEKWWSERSFERSTEEIYAVHEHERMQIDS
ncbi:hypothetical protein C8Q76DRAFT_814709 [Earliella scabrosa]|nr:hypothetical protein C8Q76DRAFT_814709 [Earliella scabrosa]